MKKTVKKMTVYTLADAASILGKSESTIGNITRVKLKFRKGTKKQRVLLTKKQLEAVRSYLEGNDRDAYLRATRATKTTTTRRNDPDRRMGRTSS